MRQTINILIILLVCAVIAASANFKPFTLEHLNETDNLKTVIDKTNRNNEKHVRKDREGQAADNAKHLQSDTARTDASGIDTVYLVEKYATNRYGVLVTPAVDAIMPAFALSDSSFLVVSYGVAAAGDGGGTYNRANVKYQWLTIGEKKTTE